MIASGKGGVGKSSITANFAVALASGDSALVCSTPTSGASRCRASSASSGDVSVSAGKMQPLERTFGDGAVKLLSMGLLADEDQALLWRGLIVQKAVAQFIEDADWTRHRLPAHRHPAGNRRRRDDLGATLATDGSILVTTPSRRATRRPASGGLRAQVEHTRFGRH